MYTLYSFLLGVLVACGVLFVSKRFTTTRTPLPPSSAQYQRGVKSQSRAALKEISGGEGTSAVVPAPSMKVARGELAFTGSTHHSEGPHTPYTPSCPVSSAQSMERVQHFLCTMENRRSLRAFSKESVSRPLLDLCLRAALHNSPSGANCQPWTFVVVETKEMKRQVREIVEAEEKVNYERRMNERWKEDLSPLGTTWEKPYLEDAPALVIVFKQTHGGTDENGKRIPHYYVDESVSIAVGIFIAAITHAGLVTLTSTPMNAGPSLRSLLSRPQHEKVMFLLPVGYPAEGATVPVIGRKPLEETAIWV